MRHKKTFLLIFFLLSFSLFTQQVFAEYCCGYPEAQSPYNDKKKCFNFGSTCKTEAAAFGRNLKPCSNDPSNVVENEDVNGDGQKTEEDYYNKDCFVQIKAPSEVKITDFGRLFSGAVSFLLLIAFILAFFYLILGGISWLTSGGDKANIETARNKIIAAIIGLIIVAATWALFQLVGGAIGFDIIGAGGFKLPTLY